MSGFAVGVKDPKYNFGLLETPSSAVTSNTECSSTKWGNTSSIGSSSMPSMRHSAPNNKASSTMPGSSSSSTSTFPAPGTSRSRTPGSLSSKTPRQGGPSSINSRTPGSRRTPHTTSSTTPGTGRETNSAVIVALVEGRGIARGEVGMAQIDLKQPILSLSQFSDSPTYPKLMTKLQMCQPVEIVMPSTACENGNMTKLFKLISDQFTNTNIATVQRKYFNEEKGLQYIKQLCVPEYNTVEMEVASKYYCLATTAALLKYVEFIQNTVYAPASLKVVFKGSEHTTMIDAATVNNLELLQNLRDPKSEHSLFGVLNHTKTVGGNRLLRATILQPPSSLETINLRLDTVSELTENEELFYNLRGVVSRFVDIDYLLSLCVQIPKQETLKSAESKITNVIYLKHTLELLAPLQNALKDSTTPLLRAYYNTLQDPRFDIIIEKIHTIIQDDTRYQKGNLNMRTQKCFAVKPKINGLLDVARRTYTEIVNDIAELTGQLSADHNLPLKTAYNSTRGFFIQLYCGGKQTISVDSLPGIFVKVTKFKNTIGCTTADMIKYNERIKESLQEIYLMTNVVVSGLLVDIREHIGCLYKLTECVAMLDMLVSFAHACTVANYCRPEFTDTLAIKQGRHPILDQITIDSPVPNNTYASEDSNFLVITGPNMSGKSTYLRQIVLLQIMAQIGSYVPAEYASFRIADQIFSRIGSDDDIETNSSTFEVEMREMNYIVQNASNKSLIIIDELGRGTSAEEGIGICWGICEYFISLKAYTFFATHFMDLTNLDSLYPNAENYHFEVERVFSREGNCDKVTYTHVLSKGKTKEKHYGLQLAEICGLPKTLVDDAKKISSCLVQQKQAVQETDLGSRQQRAVFKLGTRLVQTARNSCLDESSIRSYLQSLRDQYARDLQGTDRIEEE
ncbi:unnamed protein product [Owenia fusiformis]|uniref:DNA mismatch repair proteins mutS family domain-containing protein n=1 Tax=Owenia fusiformis TaxID=6347 RepID=A0A8S4N062_OWEFU|nr:unnamed protein product [Owenia fusiformis]